MKFQIKNCNCINEAQINIQENALNIKYGANGTGKTSVCKAILAEAKDSKEELMELCPYGISEEDEEHQPMVLGMPFSNVRVFDESYVNSYLFKENSFLENSFQVFLKSSETDKLSIQINTLLFSLQNVFHETEEIHNLSGFLPQYFDQIKYADGEVKKRGGVGEFIRGNGGGFENYSELNEYSPFYKDRDMGSIAKWAKWRNDGTRQMNGNSCPFCTHQMNIAKIDEQNKIIGKVFKNSA